MEWSPIRMTYHVRTYRFGERLILLGKQIELETLERKRIGRFDIIYRLSPSP